MTAKHPGVRGVIRSRKVEHTTHHISGSQQCALGIVPGLHMPGCSPGYSELLDSYNINMSSSAQSCLATCMAG